MYRQKRQELEADPEAPSGIASGIGRVETKVGFEWVKAIPGVGDEIGEFVDQDAIAEKGGIGCCSLERSCGTRMRFSW